MDIGIIGLGRMGGNIAKRLMRGGHKCVVLDRNQDALKEVQSAGALAAKDSADMLKKLTRPRAVWLMLPAGAITEKVVAEVAAEMRAGDILIDGGNSFYRDDIRRARTLREHGIRYVDVGTSGGVWGLERGYCLMIGGDGETVKRLDPIFAALAPGIGDIERTAERHEGSRDKLDPRAERGYIHAGPAGAGHFVKMIHNGIEYGLMQAYAEGFELLKGRASERLPEDQRFEINLPDVAEVWRRGSVISSWLLDLCAIELAQDH